MFRLTYKTVIMRQSDTKWNLYMSCTLSSCSTVCAEISTYIYIYIYIYIHTGRFMMFSVITNIYNKKTKGLNLMELFTATGKLK
jgi:hypothetical protein